MITRSSKFSYFSIPYGYASFAMETPEEKFDRIKREILSEKVVVQQVPLHIPKTNPTYTAPVNTSASPTINPSAPSVKPGLLNRKNLMIGGGVLGLAGLGAAAMYLRNRNSNQEQ